jgi:hypothetical protein
MGKKPFRPEVPTEHHRKAVLDVLCQLSSTVGMVRSPTRGELSRRIARCQDAINETVDRVRGNRPASFPMTWGDLDLFLSGACRAVLGEDSEDAPAPRPATLVRVAASPDGCYERPPAFVIEDAWGRFMGLCTSCAAIRHDTEEAVHAWGRPIQTKAVDLWTEMASRDGGPTWGELEDVMRASVAMLHEAMKE